MALYEKLSSSSSAEDIAAAYDEFVGLAGGDTAANQKQAVDYLSSLGIGTPAISQAYDIYQNPVVDTSVGGLSNVTTGNDTVNTTSGATGLTSTDTTSGLSALNNTGATGADTTSGLSALNNTGSTTGSTVDSTTGATTGTTKTYTQAEINRLLSDALSTDPNANRNDITTAAAKFGITADQVNTAYNNLSNISNSGYVKPTSGLGGIAGQKVIEGDDIATQIAQLPTEYASWGGTPPGTPN